MPEKSGSVVYGPPIVPVDFSRMRQERCARAQAVIKKNKVAAALLFRPDNIRYVTSSGSSSGGFVERLTYTLAFAEH